MAAIIRFVREKDAKELAEIYRYYVQETPITLEYKAPDSQEIINRIRTAGENHPWLVCELDGVIVGYAYASVYHERAAYQWCAKLSVYTRKGMEGKRLGTALYSGVLRLLRAQGYYKAYSSVTLPNLRSVALHRSMGFTQFGSAESTAYKFDRWFDVAHYERRLIDCDGAPCDVRQLSAISPDEIDKIFAECAALIQA